MSRKHLFDEYNMPGDLIDYPHWVLYKLENTGKKKPDKILYDPRTGKKAKSTDPSTWTSFKESINELNKSNGRYAGPGFVFSGHDPFCGIDLDNCIENGQIQSWAKRIMDNLNSYCEYSPSKTGIHIIVKGKKPGTKCRVDSIEIYDRGRFFTVTGHIVPGYPSSVKDRQAELNELYYEIFGDTEPAPAEPQVTNSNMSEAEIIERIKQSDQNGKFSLLWDGIISGYTSQSEADLALCSILAFWTGNSSSHIDSLFRRSGLMRDKWDERRGRDTYGNLTIVKAIAGTTEVYKRGKRNNFNCVSHKGVVMAGTATADLVDNLEREFNELKPEVVNSSFTESGNAELFNYLYGNRFYHIPERKIWVYWDGVRWVPNNEIAKLTMLNMAKLRGKSAITIDDNTIKSMCLKWAKTSEAKSKINNSLEIASWFLKKHQADFDTNQFCIGCTNGVVDLKTGKLTESSRDDYITMSTGVFYDDQATCDSWIAFLETIFMGDKELIDYIWRAIGYSLTGSTDEQVILIPYGSGANGKSTFLSVIQKILGDYGTSTPSDTLIYRRGAGNNIPNDLARLYKIRFVWASEVNENVRLNEGKIKIMTGGDSICARHLFCEFFEFKPEFKIWYSVNHKPIIRGTDEAIWRRIRLIPFERQFSEDERLPQKVILDQLYSELPGILSWAVRGCLEWQKKGLRPIYKVRSVTEEYRLESDIIGQFLEDCLIQNMGEQVKARELYNRYKEWCEENGERELTANAFGRRLFEKGYTKVKKGGNIFYLNVVLQ